MDVGIPTFKGFLPRSVRGRNDKDGVQDRNDKKKRCLFKSKFYINKNKKICAENIIFYVYIMASASGTLYIGFTNNLQRRVLEHKEGKIVGFSNKYSCNKLVYYEHYQDVYDAINREKEIKKWRREKKQNLIKSPNPYWNDLYNKLFK